MNKLICSDVFLGFFLFVFYKIWHQHMQWYAWLRDILAYITCISFVIENLCFIIFLLCVNLFIYYKPLMLTFAVCIYKFDTCTCITQVSEGWKCTNKLIDHHFLNVLVVQWLSFVALYHIYINILFLIVLILVFRFFLLFCRAIVNYSS